MDNEWDVLLELVNAKELSSASWTSDQVSLQKIINWARKNGVNPSGVSSIDNTKLRTIIKEVGYAINKNDIVRVTELFEWAKKLTIVELRHNVGITPLQTIPVQLLTDLDKNVYVIKLSKEQFERIKADTKAHFKFVMDD